MKKLLILLPLLAGCAFLNGCVGEVAVDQPEATVYGDPYYVAGDVQYYNDGGRYYYFRNRQRFYVTQLPSGGRYSHGNAPHNDVNVNRNVVTHNNNVHQQTVVHTQHTKGAAVQTSNDKGKKKGDHDHDH